MLFAQPITNVEEADVGDVADNENGAACLHDFEHTNVNWFASNSLDQREHDMPPIENRNWQHANWGCRRNGP